MDVRTALMHREAQMDDWKDHWMSWIPVLEKNSLMRWKRLRRCRGARPGSYSPGTGTLRPSGKETRRGPRDTGGCCLSARSRSTLHSRYGYSARSAQKAEPVLERIHFPTEKRERVLHAIRVHDVSATSDQRTSIESKILYDADKIDTLGS